MPPLKGNSGGLSRCVYFNETFNISSVCPDHFCHFPQLCGTSFVIELILKFTFFFFFFQCHFQLFLKVILRL